MEPADDEELEQMRKHMPEQWQSSATRLACRLRVRGPGVVLEKRGFTLGASAAVAFCDDRP